MKIVLFGRDGQLGLSLNALLGGMELSAYGRREVDLADGARLRDTLMRQQPRVIINAAAYTAVDQAESDAGAAARINGEAPRIMAQAARELGALLVHYSTDYVFDGKALEPYTEDSPTEPLGVYGRTKLEGEQAVRDAGCAYLVIRTAWLYSGHGRNFLKTMLRLASERNELRVVDDQIGSPTYAGAVAEGSMRVLAAMADGEGFRAGHSGVYHMTCAGAVSWCGFARRIIELSGLGARVHVTPIGTAEYPTPARRPAYSVLSCDKLERVFGIRLPHWEVALGQCLARDGDLA
ncbi:MAG: dTDP-4-dehydrorhamnose reductase [Gammaproteobacteria bacterium]|nr:dTDP-4-dehydrorhamnose reductase [Gammaproteobacteria bacterium]